MPRADQVQKVLHQPIWCSDCGTTTRSSSPKPCPRQSLSRQNGSIDTYRPTTLENSPTIVSSQGAKSVYSWGSSLVHGYKWAVDYAGGMRWFGMIADSLAAAINMTECAVALYEAVSRAPEGERESVESYVPARLEPTIALDRADLFVAALQNEGVERIFGVPGEENLDLFRPSDIAVRKRGG